MLQAFPLFLKIFIIRNSHEDEVVKTLSVFPKFTTSLKKTSCYEYFEAKYFWHLSTVKRTSFKIFIFHHKIIFRKRGQNNLFGHMPRIARQGQPFHLISRFTTHRFLNFSQTLTTKIWAENIISSSFYKINFALLFSTIVTSRALTLIVSKLSAQRKDFATR